MKKSSASASRSPRHSRSEWKNIVKRFSESQLPIEQFCQQEGILPITLRKWQRQFKVPSASDSFVEVVAAPDVRKISTKPLSSVQPWDIELDLGHGMALRIRQA